MAKVTREDLLKATSYFYGSKIVNYTDLLASHTGVEIGDEIPANEIGEAPSSFTNVVYDELDRVIEVEEFELYVAARFEDENDDEIVYFALNEIEE